MYACINAGTHGLIMCSSTCLDTSGQSNGIEVAFSERSFTALESSEEITISITISGNAQEPFDLNVIPIAKYPLDAEGTINCVH